MASKQSTSAREERSWKDDAIATFIITIAGSVLEARERRIGGAIYRQTVDWTHASVLHSRKPMEFAAQGVGNAMLALRYDLADCVLHLSLEIRHEYLDTFFASFHLEEVKRTEVDTLKEMLEAQETRLQDSAKLLENIEQALKARVKEALAEHAPQSRPYMSVSSQTACGNQQMVTWNGGAPAVVTPSHFLLSADKCIVTVLVAGLYQVHVRLAGTQTANTQFLALVVDGGDYAKCLQSEANSHQNTAQILEIIPLKANSTVQVRCGCSSNSLAEAYIWLGPYG